MVLIETGSQRNLNTITIDTTALNHIDIYYFIDTIDLDHFQYLHLLIVINCFPGAHTQHYINNIV